MIERFLDYIQFTANFKEIDCISNNYERIPPTKFYKRGYRMPDGYRLYFGNQNPKATKAFVVASGQTLENARAKGLTDQELLAWIFHEGGNITRLDLAVTEWNTFNGLLDLSEVKSWYAQGQITSNLTTHGCKVISSLLLDGLELPETVYIGNLEKRGRLGLFRGYDKGIQLNLGEYMATRIELEERGEKAQASARRLESTGDFSGVFRSRFNVKNESFERLMDSEAMPIQRGKSKQKETQSDEQKRRWDWLINQVAPSLSAAYRQDLRDGLGDKNITQFIIASGLADEMIRAVNIASENKYRDAWQRNNNK